MLRQLGGHPAALGTVALLMALFAFVPGLPFLPFILGSLCLAGTGFVVGRRRNMQSDNDTEPEPAVGPVKPETIGDILDLDDIHVEFSTDLVNMVLDPSTGLEARVENIRRHVATGFGVILPEIRLTDAPELPDGTYIIRLHGVEQARDRLYPDQTLALIPDDDCILPDGIDVDEPVYRAPARWIAPTAADDAAVSGATVVGPAEVLATHLLEVIKLNLSRILGMRSLRRLLDELTNLSDPARAAANKRMIDELIPEKISPEVLLSVLRLLLEERVSIRNMPLILDAIAELRGSGQSPETICEHVRQRIGFQLVAELRREDGTIPLLQLAPEWEDLFVQYQIEPGNTANVALPPKDLNRLATAISERIARLGETGVYPALVTSSHRRRYLRSLLASKSIPNAVLSYDELGIDAKPALVGTVAA
jgi:flagellar biosynthesis protein FlhA